MRPALFAAFPQSATSHGHVSTSTYPVLSQRPGADRREAEGSIHLRTDWSCLCGDGQNRRETWVKAASVSQSCLCVRLRQGGLGKHTCPWWTMEVGQLFSLWVSSSAKGTHFTGRKMESYRVTGGYSFRACHQHPLIPVHMGPSHFCICDTGMISLLLMWQR